jgi:hypothetical protein
MSDLDHLKLWTVLQTKGELEQRSAIHKLVEFAAPILDRVIETFPTYTLHSSAHARNVAERMADLLGPRLDDLSALEAAMLILSAYFHDIGMVFNDEERAELTHEPEWKTFLDQHPAAFVAVEETGEVTRNIAEWYCRWRHADRVTVWLEKGDDALRWDGTSLREPLAAVCRSHNESAKAIADSDALQTNFLAKRKLLK